MTNIGIVEACWPQDPDRVLALFRAYIDELGIDLSFQGVYQELASFPGKYARPNGLVLLARGAEGGVVGTAAYGSFGPGAWEMKRLYITRLWRRHGIGRLLCVRMLDGGRAIAACCSTPAIGWCRRWRSIVRLHRGAGVLPQPY